MKALTRIATAVVAGLLLFGVVPATVAVTATIFALTVIAIYGGDPAAFSRSLVQRAYDALNIVESIVTCIEEEVTAVLKAK